jgi:hypothetical protein
VKLLISVINEKEAKEAVAGGADIIDVKNPLEGSMGANYPRIIRRIRELVPSGVEVSAAIGDFPNLPGTASLAALGAAVCKVDYVKVGLYGTRARSDARKLLQRVCEAVKEYDASIKVIAAGYADYENIGSVNPLLLPKIAHAVKADGVMIDTKRKNRRKIFDFLNDSQLKSFVENAHKLDLIAAIAGSLGKEDIVRVYETGADVIGIRGSVCTRRDRVGGKVKKEFVQELANLIRSLRSRQVVNIKTKNYYW